jgi:RES domain-containing protein
LISGWRISKARYAIPPSSAFDGEGARRRGGRWSAPGHRVAYASANLALAALEYFVNLDPQDAPTDLVSVRVDIPDEIQVDRIESVSLPQNWQQHPYPTKLQDIGDLWLESRSSVCLLVPSVVIPEEYNFLVNPEHPAFNALAFHEATAFVFDPRMWK